MDRRKFLRTSCALGILGVAGSSTLLESCKKNNVTTSTVPQGPTVNFTLDLTQQANVSLNTPGGAVALNGVIVANAAGTFMALAQSCTHQGCSIGYNASANNFICPCHGGSFDTNGNVTGGPPPAPLKKYTVTKNASILTIVG